MTAFAMIHAPQLKTACLGNLTDISLSYSVGVWLDRIQQVIPVLHCSSFLSFKPLTYFRKSKSKWRMSCVALLRSDESASTNMHASGDNSLNALISVNFPRLASTGTKGTTSFRSGLSKCVISKWFNAASTRACILITNVQSSAPSTSNGSWLTLKVFCSHERTGSVKAYTITSSVSLVDLLARASGFGAGLLVFFFTSFHFLFGHRDNLLSSQERIRSDGFCSRRAGFLKKIMPAERGAQTTMQHSTGITLMLTVILLSSDTSSSSSTLGFLTDQLCDRQL